MLSIQERVKKFGRLYVRNKLDKAVVVVNFRVAGRQPYVLKIPPSPYPYEIFPKRLPEVAIRDGSDELTRFIDQGVLEVVPGMQARAILSAPEVKEETETLMRRANSDDEARKRARSERLASESGSPGAPEIPSNSPIESSRVKVSRGTPLDNLLQAQTSAASTAPSYANYQAAFASVGADINARVLGLMASYLPGRDNATISSLKSMASQLSLADLNFVISRAAPGSQTHNWASLRLARLTGAQAQAPADPPQKKKKSGPPRSPAVMGTGKRSSKKNRKS